MEMLQPVDGTKTDDADASVPKMLQNLLRRDKHLVNGKGNAVVFVSLNDSQRTLAHPNGFHGYIFSNPVILQLG